MSRTLDGIREGDRVQLHPATDHWMRGDRFGDVVRIGRSMVSVLLDKSGRVIRIRPIMLTIVEGRGERDGLRSD